MTLRLSDQRWLKQSGETTLDAALMSGVADIEAGRVTLAETVFDELERKYRTAAELMSETINGSRRRSPVRI